MLAVLAQMALLVAAGVVWRASRPGGMDMDSVRLALTSAVYYFFLPALVFEVLSTTHLSLDSLRLSFLAASGVLAGLGLAWLACRACGMAPAVTGAVVLASAFPNATYLGLPVLEAVLGPPGRSIAIQYDLFACLPLLLTVGVLSARHFGRGDDRYHPLVALMRVPALVAALLAVLSNHFGWSLPDFAARAVHAAGAAVIPIMLVAVGMSLQPARLWRTNPGPVAMAALIQLLLMPLLVYFLSGPVGMQGALRTGVVLEAAMPSMLLGIVICDRYRLDTGVYAAAVTLTTALAFLSLPFWFDILSQS